VSSTVVGRFAPSPTGPLHAGSLVAAMASWLDVRARGGHWLVRIEDLDAPREIAGSSDDQVATLAAYGFRWDGAIVRQSARGAVYEAAFEHLRASGLIYPCGCTRREVEEASSAPAANLRPGVYPGTCRHGLPIGREPRAWRLRVPDETIAIDDRAAGRFEQDLARDVGDFVVRRADGLWAYQLAVVVDDAAQGVTDVVRGADLLDSTPRQRLLQQALGLPSPRTLHVPLVLDTIGDKLSKGHGAIALVKDDPLPALDRAARHLGLEIQPTTSLESFWETATATWARRYPAPD
jgi:glutamyl-Q tRNA(Asp) synthetase